jgi:Cof subfamily protein (haloacid dehalogenase superfamily)
VIELWRMPPTPELPRLVATDLDGTLLRSDGAVSARTRRALKRARSAGIELVMVTGRPPRHVAKIEGVVELGGSAICVNGALIYDLDRELLVSEERLSAPVARELVQSLRLRLPGICFAVEVGLEFGWEPSYGLHRKRTEQPRLPIADALLLCERGVNKLIARHPQLSTEELLERSRDLFGERAQVSYSGAPFLEISAAEVSKASALAAYCAARGIDQGRVLSFGDMPNDLPMLEWAGHSVAMGNAHPSVLAACHEVTLSNEQDGVATVVERLLSGQSRENEAP